MASVVTNLPADFAEVSEELQDGDCVLGKGDLEVVSLFESLKRAPSFEKFPDTVVLRACQPGRVMCSQGESGATAFFILPPEDYRAIMQVRGETPEPLPSDGASEPQVVAHARLLADMAPDRKRRGPIRRLLDRLTIRAKDAEETHSIPIDGPADLDARTMSAPLREGDIFGEMSCMNRAPRSATVIVDQPCYMLEMLKNIYDMLQKDPAYQKRMEAVYRQRVLETHIRKLSIFKELTDSDYEELKSSITLENHESGTVIFDEHAESDCFYVIRSGLVKVVKGVTATFDPEAISQTVVAGLPAQLADMEKDYVAATVLENLPDSLRQETADSLEPDAVRSALNAFILQPGICQKFGGKTTEEVVQLTGLQDYAAEFANYPDKLSEWSDLDARIFNRLLLEQVLPALPARMLKAGNRRVLAYLGRGDFIGEMGVMTGDLRSATCVAYDHPDSNQKIAGGPGAVPSRVELVRIDRDVLLGLAEKSPALKAGIEAEIERRKASTAEITRQAGTSAVLNQSKEFEELGLIQGQKLMLIDLDRCTRCGECVNACVDAHEDGRTRLYLDGPRFEQYLVPLSCRKCLDPVCMIGCPVGAIVRGHDNEIQIKNWCVGCTKCADQCPYGSIQMNALEGPPNPLESLASEAQSAVKKVSAKAVVCDMCTSTVRGEPSCVYACPHEAAIRVNAQEFFFSAESAP